MKHQSVQEYNIGKMNIPGLSGRINRVKLILRTIQVEISECDLHVAILKEYLDINRERKFMGVSQGKNSSGHNI